MSEDANKYEGLRPLTPQEKQRLLHFEELRALEENTPIMVKWPWGNGPHRYYLRHGDDGRLYAAMGPQGEMVPHKHLRHVGRSDAFTRVFLWDPSLWEYERKQMAAMPEYPPGLKPKEAFEKVVYFSINTTTSVAAGLVKHQTLEDARARATSAAEASLGATIEVYEAKKVLTVSSKLELVETEE